MGLATSTRSICLSLALVFVCAYVFLSSTKRAPSIVPSSAPSLLQSKNAARPYTRTLENVHTPKEQRPLITYAYYEVDFARENLRFFVEHALHDAADFIFILNGETDVDEKIIFADPNVPADLVDVLPKRSKSNIFVKRRPNLCFDLGAHAEVLNGSIGGDGWFGRNGPIPAPRDATSEATKLRNLYKRYILMNASVRGPFMPRWSSACWSDAYLNRLTDKVKLVGSSYNCHNLQGHIQSMLWATDVVGLQHILSPGGIGECFSDMRSAIDGEVRTTQYLRDHGYEVDVFNTVYHSKNKETKWDRMRAKKGAGIAQFKAKRQDEDTGPIDLGSEEYAYEDSPEEQQEDASRQALGQQLLHKQDNDMPGNFWRSCRKMDWLQPGNYYGMTVHPYENLFMKSHRHLDDNLMDRLTEWHDGSGYESYDVCK